MKLAYSQAHFASVMHVYGIRTHVDLDDLFELASLLWAAHVTHEAADAVESGVGEDVRRVDRQEGVEHVEDGSELTKTSSPLVLCWFLSILWQQINLW